MPSNITVRLPSMEDLDVFAIGQWEVWSSTICFCCLFYLCMYLKIFSDSYLPCYSVWVKLISLFEFTRCSVSWLKLDSFVTCYCVKLVFLAPTYKLKLGSSWKAIKYQLFYDESFPERPFESKVFSRIILFSCSHFTCPCLLCSMGLLCLISGIVLCMCICTGIKKLHD